jgi:hypothetical protein
MAPVPIPKNDNLPFPPEIRNAIWEQIFPKNAIYRLTTDKTGRSDFAPLAVCNDMRSEVMDLLHARANFDLSLDLPSTHDFLPPWLQNVEHITISPSKIKFFIAATHIDKDYLFPKLKTVSIAVPKPKGWPTGTLDQLLGGATDEARRYGVSILFRRRLLCFGYFDANAAKLLDVAQLRKDFDVKEAVKIGVSVKLACDARLMVPLDSGCGKLVTGEGEEEIELAKGVELWKAYIRKEELALSAEMMRRYFELKVLEIRNSYTFESHLKELERQMAKM